MTELDANLRTLCANAIRALSIDAVDAANSGHPGAPMGLADIATVLWAEVLRFDPGAPDWANRDRFVLSNGHGSMLLYAILHLTGHELSLDEVKRFRQMGSKTPGHPEYGITPGVETTTGPLGQGFANAVGFALGTRMAKARFNGHGGFDPIDHRVYGILGDGCVMEGITSEAASLAGHWGLGELIFIYDDNGISIDGSTALSLSEDVEKRYQAYGWHTLRADGHDQPAIKAAIEEGQKVTDRPTLIIAKTHIGYGSPNRQDTAGVHGSPLGAEESKLTKEKLGWTHGPFEVPDAVRAVFSAAADAGRKAHSEWSAALADWKKAQPEAGQLWDAHWTSGPTDLSEAALDALKDAKGATRGMSGTAINALAAKMPRLVGGSADLTGSNKTDIKGAARVHDKMAGRYIHYGVREHAMGAINNGLALYGAFVPYDATFLVFSDYMRTPLRLAALMKIRSLHVFTHDSIGLGEDGPTHQAVEHLWALRLIPGFFVWRPADGVETAMAWAYSVGQGEDAPHALVFTRQGVAKLERPAAFTPKDVWKGGYVVKASDSPQVVFVATGSEVGLAVEVATKLEADGVSARVVSMPCVERFEAQDEAYRTSVLPPDVLTVSIEAGRSGPWRTLTGAKSINLGVDAFGESGPYEEVYAHFGLTTDAVYNRVKAAL